MGSVISRLAGLCLLASLTACSLGDEAKITYLRAVNTITDSPAVDVYADLRPIGLTLSYRGASGVGAFSLVEDFGRSRDLEVRPVLPDGERGAAVLRATIQVAQDVETNVVLIGTYDQPSYVLATSARRQRPVSQVYFQFVHVATVADTVDVYVTAPDTPLTSSAPFATLAPLQSSESLEIPFGDTRITVTRAGTLEVLFESADLPFVDNPDSREDGTEWLLAIADTIAVSPAPVYLIGTADDGGPFQLYDRNTGSALRSVHASQDTPALDVVANEAFSAPLASNLAYSEASTMALVAAGLTDLDFTAAGSSTEIYYEDQIDLEIGAENTYFLINDFAEVRGVAALADRRSVATQARLRIVHASPDTGLVSAYLTTDPTIDLEDQQVLTRNMPFGELTAYVPFSPDGYQLTLTEKIVEEGQNPNNVPETPLYGPVDLTLPDRSVQTIIVLPPASAEEQVAVQTYDDLAP